MYFTLNYSVIYILHFYFSILHSSFFISLLPNLALPYLFATRHSLSELSSALAAPKFHRN